MEKQEQQILNILKTVPNSEIVIPKELKTNPTFMLEVIKIDASKLRCASTKLKNNPSFMLDAIKIDWHNVRYASVKLRNDASFMLDAFRINAQCLQYASKELKTNSTFMLEVIKIYHNDARNDRGYLSSEIINNLSDELHDNPSYILELIKMEPNYVRYASYRLKNNPNFMLEAIKIDSTCFQYVSNEVLHNLDFIFEVIDIYKQCVFDLPEELYCNERLMLKVIEVFPVAFHFLDYDGITKLKEDPNFMLEAIKINIDCLKYIMHSGLFNDPDFVLKAIEINPICLKYASDKLRTNLNFILKAIKIDENCVDYVSEKLKISENQESLNIDAYEEYKRQYRTKLINNPQLIHKIPLFLFDDFEFMLQVAEINPDVINIAPVQLQENIQFLTSCENAKINKVKEARAQRTGELSDQDKMLDYIDDLEIQLLDYKRKNLLLRIQINSIQTIATQALEEELGGISHGQR